MTQAADDCTGSRRLTGIHAGTGKRYDRHSPGVELRVYIELTRADSRRHADAFAEVGEVQHSAKHFAVERRTDIGIR